MAKLMFEMMASLDGYTSSPDDNFDWGGVDDTVHQHARSADDQEVQHLSTYVARLIESRRT